MILREVLEKTESHFRKLGFERPRFEAEMAVSAALKWKRMDLFVKFDYPLQETEVVVCRDYVMRRSKGEPLAYIEQDKEFYGLSFYVDKNVLIPRPETEHLVDRAVELVKTKNLRKFLDIGCGSGCVSIALLKTCPEVSGIAIDISAEAVAISQKNAVSHQVESRLEVLQGDFATATDIDYSEMGLVVSNPPYIDFEDTNVQKEVRDYEPHLALFAKGQGLDYYRIWFQVLADKAMPQTHFVFEIGWQQRQDIINILTKLKVFEDIHCIQDYSGKDRIIYCKKK